jgi:aspartate-semialdehyde dehydrogenase
LYFLPCHFIILWKARKTMKLKCAVLGATGVVGQYFLKLLAGHPFFTVAAVCASDARNGQRLGDIRPHTAEGIPPEFADLRFDAMDVSILAKKEVKLVFSALPADIAKDFEKQAAMQGIHVFSNASSYRMDADVPILIPEINHDHLQLAKAQLKCRPGFIITNANCTSTGLALALLPIASMHIKKLIIASYQAISGAGYPGVAALDISGNVIPHIEGEEAKVRKECAKIFGRAQTDHIIAADWQIYAHCVRGPTLYGHLVSMHVEVDNPCSLEELRRLYANFAQPKEIAGLPTAPDKPLIVRKEPNRPQPALDVWAGSPAQAAGMAVSVGKLEVEGNVIRLVSLSHNLVRGAAGGSVLNAELALREKLL